jgi:hypothetical protein
VHFGRRAKPAEVEQIRIFLREQGLADDAHKLDPKLTFVQDWRGIKEETLWGKLKLFLYHKEWDCLSKAIAKNKGFKDPHPWGALQMQVENELAADIFAVESNRDFQQLLNEAEAKGFYSPIQLIHLKQPPNKTLSLYCRRGTFPSSFVPQNPKAQ